VYIENIAALQKQRLERRKTTKSSLWMSWAMCDGGRSKKKTPNHN
jgi:hypothetical protein